MSFEQLEYVVEVAKSGSLSTASKKLHITQSALSQSITNIEKDLEIQIFERTRKGTVPTEIGMKVIEKAHEVLNKLDELKAIASTNSNLIEGELTVGTIPGSSMFLPKVLSLFNTEYPNINLSIVEKPSQDIMNEIKQDKLDIGFVGLTREGKEKEDSEINLRVVLRGQVVIAVSKDSPLASLDKVKPSELLAYPLVIYNDDRLWEFVDYFNDTFGKLRIMFSTNNIDDIRKAVNENWAITIGPDYTVKSDPFVLNGDGVVLEIADFEQDYPGMALVWSKTSRNKNIKNNFVEKLIDQLND